MDQTMSAREASSSSDAPMTGSGKMASISSSRCFIHAASAAGFLSAMESVMARFCGGTSRATSSPLSMMAIVPPAQGAARVKTHTTPMHIRSSKKTFPPQNTPTKPTKPPPHQLHHLSPLRPRLQKKASPLKTHRRNRRNLPGTVRFTAAKRSLEFRASFSPVD